jgi:hypothetical protein
MERTAKMMQEDMPLTFQDMQRTSKEFEILGKQLNYLAGVVVSARCCVCSLALWWGQAGQLLGGRGGERPLLCVGCLYVRYVLVGLRLWWGAGSASTWQAGW